MEAHKSWKIRENVFKKQEEKPDQKEIHFYDGNEYKWENKR